ncbi:Rossmann-fold NAD(P)-binding domain-containing protein [Daejeonella oryzae]|uniref:hypothetical protein n=1 Tax=Daejeonella oryzae TaxID=1122943 RepID=UPI0003F98206|nr:hypothetical protein [Daejeonella oryzae]
MINNKAVSILGCGWLGLELAKVFNKYGFEVKGSTTNSNKLPILESQCIAPFLVHFTEKEIFIPQEFLDSDTLIISIPPGRNSPNGNVAYQNMADTLIKVLPSSRVGKIILISSTSVYGDPNKIVSESDVAIPDTESGKLLLKVENQFLQLKDKEIIVVRPGGLISEDRYPGRFFSGKKNIENGLTPVNLIHKADITQIVFELCKSNHASGIYNAVAPQHPVKKDFYTLASSKSGLIPAEFLQEKTTWKIVSGKRLDEELNYQFIYPDLMAWLTDYLNKLKEEDI